SHRHTSLPSMRPHVYSHTCYSSPISYRPHPCFLYFFFQDPAPPESYTLSLHDALPISAGPGPLRRSGCGPPRPAGNGCPAPRWRSEEHTSELQSRFDLVCRLLLEKKKNSFSHRTKTNITDVLNSDSNPTSLNTIIKTNI